MRGKHAAATAVWLAMLAGCDRAPPPPTVPPPGAAAPAAPSAARPSAEAMLARMQTRYANAKTYRDAGSCTSQIVGGQNTGPGMSVRFTTALDRAKGMRWQAVHHDGVGDPGTFTAVSSDCVTFDWSWPFALDSGSGDTAWKAFSRSLGNTSNLAGVVPALLLPSVDLRYIRLDPARLVGVTDSGDETIDGTVCFVVDASGWHEQKIRLWLDASGALRQFWASRSMPAWLDLPAYTAAVTVSYAPEFDVDIRADEIAPIEAAADAPSNP